MEKGSLHDFFTYGHQAKLINNVQMREQNYENALIEYGKIFIADLIGCLQKDEKNKINLEKEINCEKEISKFRNLCSYVNNILNQRLTKKIVFDKVSKPKSDAENAESLHNEPVKNEKREVTAITEFFLLIREVYHRWTSCDLETSVAVLNYVLKEKLKITDNDAYIIPSECVLYRGRLSENTLGKADMFHIPFMQAYKIRNQRFSITGQPLLYLTDNISGIFNEFSINSKDKYEKLFVAQYRFKRTSNDTTNSNIKIFDLKIDAQNLKEQEDQESFNHLFYKFILSCVCSFPNVRGRDNSYFVEEYVIPQLVTQLIKKTRYFDGICYNTVNIDWGKSDEKEKENRADKACKDDGPYVNYAFFTQKWNMDDSMDTDLKNKFIIDGPITVSAIDDYDSTVNYNTEKIIQMIKQHFDRINDYNSISNAAKESPFFITYDEEADYFYRDGKYRYIDEDNKEESGKMKATV